MIYLDYKETHRDNYRIYVGMEPQLSRGTMIRETKCKLSHLRRLLRQYKHLYGHAYAYDDDGVKFHADGDVSL